YGDRSATGSTLVGRALDYYSGTLAKMTGAHAVLNIKNGEKSICSIATLGAIAVGSGFNKNGVFGALLDSPTKTPYSAKGKYSYMMDLRYALENESTMEGVINYLGNPHREYPFNHNFLFSDPETSVVLENNFTGTGSNIRRAVRTEDSVLNAGVTPWNFDNSICVVNSFILQGNHDNHIGDTHNEMRWDNYVRLFGELDYVVSMDDIKKVMSYDDPNDT
ncbi:MAG: hypothetical protein GY754_09800, partial [bacterium]|nr:hypothetical protein [bacterium]